MAKTPPEIVTLLSAAALAVISAIHLAGGHISPQFSPPVFVSVSQLLASTIVVLDAVARERLLGALSSQSVIDWAGARGLGAPAPKDARMPTCDPVYRGDRFGRRRRSWTALMRTIATA